MRTRKWRRGLAVLAAPLIGLITLSLAPLAPASGVTGATESGDAPALMPGQAIAAVGNIQGTLGVPGDVDMYDFCAAGPFSAEVTEFPANTGGAHDSELFLFYANGAFITANDDIDYWGGNRLSRINHTMPTTKAHYLLAVGSFNITANGSPITSWDSSGTATGAYTIALTGVVSCTTVPGKVDTSTTIETVDPVSPSYGQTLSFDTMVAAVTPGVGTPTGTVSYEVNTFAGTPEESGYVAFDPASDSLPVGTHDVRAVYPGDDDFNGSTSNAFVVTVDKADTTTTITGVAPLMRTYGVTLSFTTTVAPVAPGAGTPTGAVTYVVNKFGNSDVPNVGWEAYDPATDVLPAGTHNVEALYPGDDNFNDSRSDTFVVTVDKATSTVTYLGDYLAIVGNDFTFKANVDSAVPDCKGSRSVTFKLTDGTTVVRSFTASSGAGGAVTRTVSTTGWTPGEFDVLVQVAESGNCTAADNAAAMDLITVASPGAAATGGGWYFWKESGAAKRVNFGFAVSQQADKTYKGSLLLMNQGAWRLKGTMDSFTRAEAQGQAGGTGTLSQWVCTNQSDPLTCSWQNPRAVSFKISFTDLAAGKAGGKKTVVVVDQFALSQISLKGSTLPVSLLMPLKGGNIVLR